MTEWMRSGDDPVTYAYTGRYLLEEAPGAVLADLVMKDIDAGKRVVVDLDAGTHCIHHHLYYGFMNRCIYAGKSDLFSPGSSLSIVLPTSTFDVFGRIVEMYRKKGYIPDPLGLNEMSPEEYMKHLNRIE